VLHAFATLAGMHKRELAHRANDGLEVSLLWNPDDGSLAVSVVDTRLGTALELPVGDASPLEVFYHPFAYAAQHGLPLAA
jgi:hypothetical protein